MVSYATAILLAGGSLTLANEVIEDLLPNEDAAAKLYNRESPLIDPTT